MAPILITGANGFVGTALCTALRGRAIPIVAATRHGHNPGEIAVGELDGATDWRAALAGCGTVIHLAARVHMMDDHVADPLQAYRQVNVEATLQLARQAVEAGVRRFVFVSSVKVNGESTTGRAPYSGADMPQPRDPYGQSKMEAEAALFALARETSLEVVVVRPPLVYGPGVRANYLNLLKLVRKGVPLPLGAVKGRRSMVSLDNLVDLLIRCAQHPAARGGVFMVSDGADLTVAELVSLMASALGKRVTLVPVPPALLYALAGLAGKQGVADRLLGSLQVDIAHTRERLEWAPVVAPQVAVATTVAHFLTTEGQKQ
ncbi:NAD-dependent epimerase/dehydratase family protein [Massilia cavernae]|uniref:NAD-dependent epimerase/dehydratase family protein n=1 Tax=Massilia cavernae TaxID=2320864 RepID=A0A418Y6J7_9BURK|nr:NAD-dependent epimerase/dehydratase family protein [Massilia cavernae]RJG23679.1 NAD-dependent epimerase/dehydratase family protein [Massilia cavernae]